MKIKLMIMVFRIGSIIIFFLSIGANVLSQSVPPKICATMEQDSISRLKFPKRGTLDEFEIALQRKIQEHVRLGFSGRTEATPITIPIIVHVVHNGEPVGTGLNLSQEQIQSQIAVLNEDFRRKVGTPGYNTNPVGADIEVEFCLSPVDENGRPMAEPGIHRYNGGKSSWTRNEIESQLKPTTIWNPNLFYNIWTVRFGGTDSNLLGYAQFPDQSGLGGLNEVGGPSSTDGVVMQYTSFGSGFPIQSPPYNKGRTLSHETGHWLGLRHIWGDGPCGNDFVADTPTVQSESRGCPTNKLSCDGVTPAMVQNYMDYSDDACMNIFTLGQKARIMAVLDLSPRRKSLVSANLCSPLVAAVPTPDFSSDKQEVLLGGEVNFTDLSSNFPTSWLWTFEGGDPNTATVRNPKVKYNVPGVYKVSLVATNSLGTSPVLERIGYIVVSNEGLCNTLSNFKDIYTPSVLSISSFGNFTGNLTGHNSTGTKAISEFFVNSQGYEYVSGVELNFGSLQFTDETATITVTVWNARGVQNGPGSVVERKVISIRQVKEDVAANRATKVVFDRETPVFSRSFHVGVELDYEGDDRWAIKSSANGEAINSTSWIQNSSGAWNPYSIALGANIAMMIKPIVGVNPSVQMSASKILAYPGEEITLNGRGASVFVWSSSDGSVSNVPGPQLIVRPTQTTTYTLQGSGLVLCNAAATTTIYIREVLVGVTPEITQSGVEIYPNPGREQLNLVVENDYNGVVKVQISSINAINSLRQYAFNKSESKMEHALEIADLAGGVYIIQVWYGEKIVTKKWIKY